MKTLKNLGIAGLMLGMLTITAGAFAEPVNINKADAKTLAKNITGIGPAKARAIIDYRRKNGAFKSVHDLTKVKGIGEKLIVKNKMDLQLTDTAVRKAGN